MQEGAVPVMNWPIFGVGRLEYLCHTQEVHAISYAHLFVEAYLDGKNQNLLRQQDLDKVIATSIKRKSVDKYAYLATPAEIAENDYNLNIPRYVDTFEEEEEIDLMAVRAEREKLKAELAVLEKQMAGYLKELGYE